MMTRVIALGMIGMFTAKGAPMHRADEIYTAGLETMITQSKVIVTGPVANFSKHVLQSHTPSGTPLRWEIQGEVREAQILKGDPPQLPIRFTRLENSTLLDQPETSPWESDYLQWQIGDRALIFFTGSDPSKEMRVYPSGSGERDLASQVGRIIAIESISDPAKRFEAWRNALTSAHAMAEKHAALRSLMAFKKPWSEMQPIFRRGMGDAGTRLFIFGLVAYGIVHEQWANLNDPAGFLCESIANETNDDLTVGYLGAFGLLLNFATEDAHREERKSLRDRLDFCLQQTCLARSKKTVEACKDLRARYFR